MHRLIESHNQENNFNFPNKISIFSFIVISLVHWEKNFFELKKVLLIQKNCLWSKEIDLFTLKNSFLNQQNFLQFKEIFSLTLYQRNVSLIQRNCFPGVQ